VLFGVIYLGQQCHAEVLEGRKDTLTTVFPRDQRHCYNVLLDVLLHNFSTDDFSC